MNFNRIKFSKDSSEALERMKGKVGLNWNILSRIGFCVSLNDRVSPSPEDYNKTDGHIEIDRKILMGKEDDLYMALFQEWCIKNEIIEDKYLDYLKAHMNRGVLLLSKRAGNIRDIYQLIPTTK